ncbi:hypothetical protein BGW41_001119 [Actinomortierella wolfii]|nr:hypothetical protein BGW41_001119 [Actinomortierella wolfii]
MPGNLYGSLAVACTHCTLCNNRTNNSHGRYGNGGNLVVPAASSVPFSPPPPPPPPHLPPEIWYHILDQALSMLLPQATTPRTYMTLIFPLLLTCHAFYNHCRPHTYPHLRKHRLLQLFTRWKAAHSREVHFYHHPLRTHVRYALPDRVGNPPGEEYETLYSFIKRSYLFGCDSVCGTVIPVEGGLDGAGLTANNAPAAPAAAAAANPTGQDHHQQQQQQGQQPNQAQINGGQGHVLIAPPPPAPAALTTPQQGGDGGGQGWKNHALQWHVANPTFAAEGTIELYRDVVEEYRRMVCGPPKTEWEYELERTLRRPREQREREQRLREQQQCKDRLPTPVPPPSSSMESRSIWCPNPNDPLPSETEWMHQQGDMTDADEGSDEEELLEEDNYQFEGDDDFDDEEEETGDEDEELETDEDANESEQSMPLVEMRQSPSMLEEATSSSANRMNTDETFMDQEENEVLNEIEAKGGLRRRDSGHGQSTSEMDIDDDEEEEEDKEEDDDDDGMQSLDEEMELLRQRQELLYALRQQRRKLQQLMRQRRRHSSNERQQEQQPGQQQQQEQQRIGSVSTTSPPLRRRRSKSQSNVEKWLCGPAAVDAEAMIMDMALDRPLHSMSPLSPLNPLPSSLPPSSNSSSNSTLGGATSASPDSRSLSNRCKQGSRKRLSSRRSQSGSVASATSSGSERSDISRPTSRRISHRYYHRHSSAQSATSATTESPTQLPLPSPLPSPPASVNHHHQQGTTLETPLAHQQQSVGEPSTISGAESDVQQHQQSQSHNDDDFDPHNLGFDLASACANTFASDLAFVLARVPGLGAHFHRFEQLSKLKLHVGWAKHAQSRGGNDVFVMSCSRLIALLAPLANTQLVSERGG